MRVGHLEREKELRTVGRERREHASDARADVSAKHDGVHPFNLQDADAHERRERRSGDGGRLHADSQAEANEDCHVARRPAHWNLGAAALDVRHLAIGTPVEPGRDLALEDRLEQVLPR